MNPEAWMNEALALAAQAAEHDEVPIGAVIVDSEGNVIGRGRNTREGEDDPSGHAELHAIAEAAKAVGDWRLVGKTMVVTLEPCAMCAGAIVNSRIEKLIFGAYDPKAGFCGTLGNLVQDERLNHRVELTGGFMEAECAALLQDFFRRLRSR